MPSLPPTRNDPGRSDPGRSAAERPPRARAAARAGARERNKREKRERIERAARRLFERNGFAQTTLREIASEAGVALGTLFLYASDKRDLLFRVFEGEARARFAAGSEAAARHEDPAEAAMALFRELLGFYARHPELSAAIVQELFFRPYEPERLGALSREYLRHVIQLVEAARDAGRLRADVPVGDTAHALFAHYAYWTQAWLGSRAVTRERAEAALARALRLQVEGLRAEGTRPPVRRARRRA